MDKGIFDATHPTKGLYGIRYGWWVIICIAYILSPIDIIPEAFLGPLGVMDDAGIAAFGVYNFARWFVGRRARSRTTIP